MSNKLTREEYAILEEELNSLHTRNQEIIRKMSEMETRDLAASTSDAFFQLKREQGDIQQRVTYIRDLLSDAVIADTHDPKIVEIGDQAYVVDLNTDQTMKFELVGSTATALEKHHITAQSPVGEALLGQKRGDVVEVETPTRTERYRVIDITPMPEAN